MEKVRLRKASADPPKLQCTLDQRRRADCWLLAAGCFFYPKLPNSCSTSSRISQLSTKAFIRL
jgi:hypothetical protein